MSTEIPASGLPPDCMRLSGMSPGDDLPAFNPVLMTAKDRPAVSSFPAPVDPAAGREDPELFERRVDVEEKHRRIAAYLQVSGFDGVILTRADAIAWFTAGADFGQDLISGSGPVALFINGTTRAVLTDNVQSARVFEEELAGLGFQLKERPWHQDPLRIIAELTHGRKTAADSPIPGPVDESDRLRSLRSPLTTLDRKSLRDLGHALTEAVEATCRNVSPGETEAEVAGQLAHRLIREGITPVELRVAGDDRLARYRRPGFKAVEILKKVNISATGRRLGLCASTSRTVAFGPVDPHFRSCHMLTSMVIATCMYFSTPGEPISEIFRRSRRIFEKFDHPDEWGLDYQGALVGYSPREVELLPENPEKLQVGQALRWSPSVVAARSEDTILLNDQRIEILTKTKDWPMLDVSVKGNPVRRPTILER